MATLLLMLALLVIFISPAFDIPETALQAKQRALQIAASLIAMAMLLKELISPSLWLHGAVTIAERITPNDHHPNEIIPLLC
jgi:hypothetical protein